MALKVRIQTLQEHALMQNGELRHIPARTAALSVANTTCFCNQFHWTDS